MKLKHTASAVETNNVTEGNTFRIKSSAKTFAILSSGLYSDKIQAVVRELTCNGYDSQTERNNNIEQGQETKHTAPVDKNMRVHFPTQFDPFFSVRDFGTGLTPEDVEGIYTVYFESTKQDSNDYTGALGLGSKSPFSYAQSFNVIATKNGHRVIYTMFINSQGIPQPAKLDEGPVESFYMADEEIDPEEFYDGVEVKVPVEPNDASSFWSAAEYVFQFFAVQPDMINGKGEIIYYKNISDMQEFIPGVHMNIRGYRSNQYAIQGNVSYPISLSQDDFKRAIKDIDNFENVDADAHVFTHTEIDELYEFYNTVLRSYNLYIKFEIGELDVAASREELSYDASTIMAILIQYKRIKDEVESKFRLHMDTFGTNWDKARELIRIAGQSTFLATTALESFYRKTKVYKTYLATANIPQIRVDSGFNNDVLIYTKLYSSLPVPAPEDRTFDMRMCGLKSNRRFFRIIHNEETPQRIHGFIDGDSMPATQDDIVIVVNDTNRGGATLARNYLQQYAQRARCLLIEPRKGESVDDIKEYIALNELKMDNPGYKVKYLSDVKADYPDLTKRVQRSQPTSGYYRLQDSFTRVNSTILNIPDSFDEEPAVVYIPFRYQKPWITATDLAKIYEISNNTIATIDGLITLLNNVCEIVDESNRPTVIGLNHIMMKQLPEYNNWISIVDYVDQEQKKLFGTAAKRQAVEQSIIEKRKTNDFLVDANWPLHSDNTVMVLDRLLEHHVLKDSDITNAVKILVKSEKKLTATENLYEKYYNIEYVNEEIAKFNSKYGMLGILNQEYSWSKYSEQEIDVIINYCMLCNQGEV